MNRSISGIFFIAIAVFSLSTLPSVTFADWDGEPYAPGETLDPECGPTDEYCTVESGAWDDDGTNAYRTSGSVGIGTDSPYGRLTIESDDANEPLFRALTAPNLGTITSGSPDTLPLQLSFEPTLTLSTAFGDNPSWYGQGFTQYVDLSGVAFDRSYNMHYNTNHSRVEGYTSNVFGTPSMSDTGVADGYNSLDVRGFASYVSVDPTTTGTRNRLTASGGHMQVAAETDALAETYGLYAANDSFLWNPESVAMGGYVYNGAVASTTIGLYVRANDGEEENTAYGLYIDAPTGANPNDYGLYVSGGAPNYFGSTIGIHTENIDTNAALHVEGELLLSGDDGNGSRYINFGDEVGVGGYGLRVHHGILEFKNDGDDDWTELGSGGGGEESIWEEGAFDTVMTGNPIGIMTDSFGGAGITIQNVDGVTINRVVNGNFDYDPDVTWSYGPAWSWQDGLMRFEVAEGQGVAEFSILSGGEGYTVGDTLSVEGGGDDAAIVVNEIGLSGEIVNAALSNAGSGAYEETTYALSGGTGEGASITVTELTSGTSWLSQSGRLQSGSSYVVFLDVGGGGGSVEVCLDAGTCETFDADEGSVYFTGTWNSYGPTRVTIRPSEDFDGWIDNVSVRQEGVLDGINFISSAGTTTLSVGMRELAGDYGFDGFQIKALNTNGGLNLATILPSDESGYDFRYFLPSVEEDGDVFCMEGLNNCSAINEDGELRFGEDVVGDDYGLRDYDGVLQYRDRGGAWMDLGGTEFAALGIGDEASEDAALHIEGGTDPRLVSVGTLDLDNIVDVAATSTLLVAIGSDAMLYTIDASDPENLAELGSVALEDTPRHIFLVDTYALIVEDSGLELIDLGDPENPEVEMFQETGYILDIALHGGYLYASVDGNLSVSAFSDPTAGVTLVDVEDDYFVRGIAVEGDYLYAAANNRLVIYDISTPAAPTFVGAYESDSDRHFATRPAYVDGHVLVIDSNAGDDDSLLSIDVSNPEEPVLADFADIGDYRYDGSILIDGDVAYVTDGEPDSVYAFDVDDPADMREITHFETGNNSYGLALIDHTIFVASDEGGILALEFASANVLALWTEEGDVLIGGLSEDNFRYLNFGDTAGEEGYGIRNNNGILQFKNQDGEWTTFGESAGSGDPSLSGSSYAATFELPEMSLPPFGIDFNDDGDMVFISGVYGSPNIEQYFLETPWDITSAEWDAEFDASEDMTSIAEIALSPAGDKLYAADFEGTILQYSFGEPWNLYTLSYDEESLDTSEVTGDDIAGFTFGGEDGDVLYILNYTSGIVYAYGLTGENISSAIFLEETYDLRADLDGEILSDIQFNADGTKMYIMELQDETDDILYEFDLAEAWDITTASYEGISYDVYTDVDGAQTGMFAFSEDGETFYVTGLDGGSGYIHEFNFGSESGSGLSWTESGSDVYFDGGRVAIGTTSFENAVLTIQQGNIVGDIEFIHNGDFSSDDNWIALGGWSIVDGVASFSEDTEAGPPILQQEGSLTDGHTYDVSFTITGENGSVDVCLDDGDCDTFYAGDGVVSFSGEWWYDSEVRITFSASSDFDGTIDDVSVLGSGTTFGTEEIEDGAFEDDTDWDMGGGWSIGEGIASFVLDEEYMGLPYILQEGSLEPGIEYTVSFYVSDGSGAVLACLGVIFEAEDCDIFSADSGEVSFTGYWTPTEEGPDVKIMIAPFEVGFEGYIDDVSVRAAAPTGGITFVHSEGDATLTIGLDEQFFGEGDDLQGLLLKTINSDGDIRQASIYLAGDEDTRFEYFLPSLADTEWGGGTFCIEELENCGGGAWTIGDGETMYYSGGRIGIGTSDPAALLDVAGAFRVDGGAIDYDEETGVTSIDNLAIGALSFPDDTGAVSWIDLPVTSASSDGTVQSYTAMIDSQPVFTIYGESNGVGGVKNMRVGIGTTSPWATFSASGTVAFQGLTAGAGAGSLCLTAGKEVVYSDAAGCTGSSLRFKHGVEALEYGALEKVLQLRPVSFLYNESIGVAGTQVGFIAEDVLEVDPRLVTLDSEGRPANVKYANFTALLAKAIQEIAERISSFADSFTTKEVQTEKLCIGDTCVTEEEFLQLLQQANVGAATAPAAEPVVEDMPEETEDGAIEAGDDAGTITGEEFLPPSAEDSADPDVPESPDAPEGE